MTVRHLLTHTSGFTYSIWSAPLGEYEKVSGMPDIATARNGAFALTGAIFTQTLPFFDPGIVDLYAQFERGIYEGLRDVS